MADNTLNIKTIDKGDTLEELVKKINYNFENIVSHGGGTAGKDGSKGDTGSSIKGDTGPIGYTPVFKLQTIDGEQHLVITKFEQRNADEKNVDLGQINYNYYDDLEIPNEAEICKRTPIATSGIKPNGNSVILDDGITQLEIGSTIIKKDKIVEFSPTFKLEYDNNELNIKANNTSAIKIANDGKVTINGNDTTIDEFKLSIEKTGITLKNKSKTSYIDVKDDNIKLCLGDNYINISSDGVYINNLITNTNNNTNTNTNINAGTITLEDYLYETTNYIKVAPGVPIGTVCMYPRSFVVPTNWRKSENVIGSFTKRTSTSNSEYTIIVTTDGTVFGQVYGVFKFDCASGYNLDFMFFGNLTLAKYTNSLYMSYENFKVYINDNVDLKNMSIGDSIDAIVPKCTIPGFFYIMKVK